MGNLGSSILSVTGLQDSIHDLIMQLYFLLKVSQRCLSSQLPICFSLWTLGIISEDLLCLKTILSFMDFFVLVLKMKTTLIHPFCPILYNTI